MLIISWVNQKRIYYYLAPTTMQKYSFQTLHSLIINILDISKSKVKLKSNSSISPVTLRNAVIELGKKLEEENNQKGGESKCMEK